MCTPSVCYPGDGNGWMFLIEPREGGSRSEGGGEKETVAGVPILVHKKISNPSYPLSFLKRSFPRNSMCNPSFNLQPLFQFPQSPTIPSPPQKTISTHHQQTPPTQKAISSTSSPAHLKILIPSATITYNCFNSSRPSSAPKQTTSRKESFFSND